jgi:hypothetical protein
MGKPRILIYDIETSLQPVAVFQLAHNDWIDPSAILSERYVICAAWKWLDEDKVYASSVIDSKERYAADPHDDRWVIEKLHEVLSKADLIVHHNGDSFDKKWVDTRILFHGLDPLPPIPSIDTYKVAKNRFYLNSNKLDYIGQLLNVGRKTETSKGLWMKVLKGDKKAIKEMVEYNKQDVLLLESVFNKLKPYIANYPSLELFDDNDGCPRCGSEHVQSRGVHRAVTRTYQRLQCQDCGGWFRRLRPDADSTTTNRVL